MAAGQTRAIGRYEGDLKNGYIVAPVSEPVFKRLREVAAKRGVPIDDLGEPPPMPPTISLRRRRAVVDKSHKIRSRRTREGSQ